MRPFAAAECPAAPAPLPISGGFPLRAALRRCRGERSLRHVAFLSRRLEAEGVPAVGESELYGLECGSTPAEPRLLWSLSAVYGVPLASLLDLAKLERIFVGEALENDPDRLRRRARACARRGEHLRLYAIALRGRSLARTPAEKSRWRRTGDCALRALGLGEAHFSGGPRASRR